MASLALEVEYLDAGLRVPDLHGLIPARGDDARAIGGERRPGDRPGMAPESDGLDSGLCVPDLCNVVLARGDDARAVGAELRRENGLATGADQRLQAVPGAALEG